jgi:SnoaL-like domain
VDQSLEDKVRQLVDRQEILDCMHRYARGVDRMDAELMQSAFFEDALDCHGPLTQSPAQFVDWWFPAQGSREATQHFIANHFADIDGDQAHAETYFIVTTKLRGEDEAQIFGGRYVDRLERRAGAWKIAVRVVITDWLVTAGAAEMAQRLKNEHGGSRSRSDPSYERPLRPRFPGDRLRA